MQITAVKFKATCLKLIDRVSETGEPVIITKRGKVLARLVSDHGKPRGLGKVAARSRSCARTKTCSSSGRESHGMLVLDTHALTWRTRESASRNE